MTTEASAAARAGLARLGRENLAVIGLGLNNLALVRFLLRQGARVTVFDRKPPEELAGRLAELGPDLMDDPRLSVSAGPGYLDGLKGPGPKGFDRIFLTPGMKKDLPEIKAAAKAGAIVTGDFELFFEFCAAPITAITGSAGKTTTTTLTGLILQAEYAGAKPVYVGGNIGRPLIDRVLEIPPEAEVILELSSYQLQLVTRSPEVGVILNLSPNHLDVHASMDEYIQAKVNAIRFQASDGWAVLNYDDETARRIGLPRTYLETGAEVQQERAGPEPAGPGVAWFSTRVEADALPSTPFKGPAPVAFLGGPDRRDLMVRGPGRPPTRICSRSELIIPGEHNVQNALAASVTAALRGAGPEAMARVLTTFRGVEHRLELVLDRGGVRYINDSIATTPERTGAALRTLGPSAPLVIILGGYDKHLPFDGMARLIVETGWVKAAVLTGVTAKAIDQALEKAAADLGKTRPAGRLVASFDGAVRAAADYAEPGDIVLLSPACASYDAFNNFEERGARFRELVGQMTEPTH